MMSIALSPNAYMGAEIISSFRAIITHMKRISRRIEVIKELLQQRSGKCYKNYQVQGGVSATSGSDV
jgi:hypothetical protein